MNTKYKVLVVGMGKRGLHHALAFQANPRFEVAGICDIDPARLDAAPPSWEIRTDIDAAAFAKSLRPECSASARCPTCAPS